MTRVYVDIETYSSVDLPKYGVYRYAESPDFRVLMAAWSVEGGPVTVQTDQDEIAKTLWDWLDQDEDVQLVAHNAQFERVCFSRLLGLPVGSYLTPTKFHDTQAVAAEYGYPSSLDNLARWLGGEQKDTAGTSLINIFCKPNRKGERTLPEDRPEKWLDFIEYCMQDVVTLIDVDRQLGDFPTETERQVFYADQVINDRGIRIDVDMARLAAEAAEDNRMAQEVRVMQLTGISNPGSQPQFLKWCQQAISPRIRNLQAETIARLVAHPKLNPVQREVLELRQELALVASKKFDSALMSVSSDGRLRGTMKFFGAHTGRWAGKGTQPHNLPREAFTYTDENGKEQHDKDAENAAILDLLMGNGASSLELKKLVRPLFYVDGAVVDYRSIEAMVTPWLAGEQWPLDAFRAGRDIYVETANRMGGLTRAQGKVAVLALGFQGGINSLKVMGGRGTDTELQHMVEVWRRANPNIVRLWRKLQEALADADETPMPVGEHLYASRDPFNDEIFMLHLPSGRALVYHGMRWEAYKVQDPRTKRMKRKEGWRYDDPKKVGMRIGTYGGRLTENVTQATARDLLAEALVRLIQRGYKPIAHVHDEGLVEGATNWHEISDVMCELPEWAEGLPVDGDGFITDRYRKG